MVLQEVYIVTNTRLDRSSKIVTVRYKFRSSSSSLVGYLRYSNVNIALGILVWAYIAAKVGL